MLSCLKIHSSMVVFIVPSVRLILRYLNSFAITTLQGWTSIITRHVYFSHICWCGQGVVTELVCLDVRAHWVLFLAIGLVNALCFSQLCIGGHWVLFLIISLAGAWVSRNLLIYLICYSIEEIASPLIKERWSFLTTYHNCQEV